MKMVWNSHSPATELRISSGLPLADEALVLSGRWQRSFVIVDSEVRRLWAGNLDPQLDSACGTFTITSDETLKTPDTLLNLWDAMARAGVRRDTGVTVIGGGLSCDVGAMAASTFQRGTGLLLVPTTLLCMVDACLGGKTGVNLRGMKNQVGTFHPAEEIIAYAGFLTTLPPREMRSGLAEALKTSLIGDPSICRLIRNLSTSTEDLDDAAHLVESCLKVKADIVMEDLRESGSRMVLNLGHTVGHALESLGSFSLTHGEAVGMGLLVEAAMASRLGGEESLVSEIREVLEEIGLPVSIAGLPGWDEIVQALDRDKKSRDAARIWALPFGWGDCRLVDLTPEQESEILPSSLAVLND